MTDASAPTPPPSEERESEMPVHGERRESDGKQWCSGCGRWKLLVIHSCPGVWRSTKVIGRDGTVERSR